MTDSLDSKYGKALDQFTGTHAPGTEDFPGEFAKLKVTVIRPTFENIGNMLKERGHQYNISEDSSGKISIHIVPAGVQQSIRPFDWFPTFSFFAAPITRTVGLHGRNMRPNSEASSGSRGEYRLAQVNNEVVEKELMKFIGEIANWT